MDFNNPKKLPNSKKEHTDFMESMDEEDLDKKPSAEEIKQLDGSEKDFKKRDRSYKHDKRRSMKKNLMLRMKKIATNTILL